VISITECISGVQAVSGNTGCKVTVYPDPNKGTFTINISSNTAGQAHIMITNLVGETVKEQTVPIVFGAGVFTDITLNEPPGVYFLSVSTPGSIYNTKIIVAR
jgi:hypothetical protein